MPRPIARPRPPAYDTVAAISALSAADPKLARLIERTGPFTLKLATTTSPFEALLESIIYQQLHGKAAAAIHAKLLRSFAEPPHPDQIPDLARTIPGAPGSTAPSSTLGSSGPLHPHPTAQHILDAPNEQLRAAGLSHNKALSLRDLAAKTLDGTVPTLARIRRMADGDIIDHLTQVRGIGEWTVQMFLIFRLGRPDVLPTNDYGVRKGFALTFTGLKPAAKVTAADLPTPELMQKRAKKWHPWCSVASWYLWRACDLAAKKPALAEAP